jgi:hypothetical protein
MTPGSVGQSSAGDSATRLDSFLLGFHFYAKEIKANKISITWCISRIFLIYIIFIAPKNYDMLHVTNCGWYLCVFEKLKSKVVFKYYQIDAWRHKKSYVLLLAKYERCTQQVGEVGARLHGDCGDK